MSWPTVSLILYSRSSHPASYDKVTPGDIGYADISELNTCRKPSRCSTGTCLMGISLHTMLVETSTPADMPRLTENSEYTT